MKWRRSKGGSPIEPAAEWFARCDAGGMSPLERADFAIWSRGPDNARALNDMEAAWAELKAVGADPDLLTMRAQALSAASGVDRRRLIVGLVGASAAIGAGGGGLVFATAAAATISTGAGERLVTPLPDGSSATLAPRTRLRLEFGENRRQVRIVQGQAWFDARHMTHRPFIVLAGKRVTRCLGGRFQVTLGAEGAEVLAETAKLTVSTPGAPALPLEQGDMSTGPASVRRLASTDVERAVAWREGHLVFDNWSLAEVAATFNRYSADRLVVANAVATMRVSGTFRYEAARDFALALSPLGVQARQVDRGVWRIEPASSH